MILGDASDYIDSCSYVMQLETFANFICDFSMDNEVTSSEDDEEDKDDSDYESDKENINSISAYGHY